MVSNETSCAKRESASCMAPRMASCEHEFFEVVFACAWSAEDVTNGSGAVGASTGVGAAAGVGSVAGLTTFFRSRQKVSLFRLSAAATRPRSEAKSEGRPMR